ncbi:helix-turn-helix transcriptional regulator [Variovorax sp. RA8]|uniref:helix-turn-helix transcriptional regulator n=1 Tax=Variovorax sp. (strain JCM 16519 / RA8) TaxID=662548 RepID=UPI0013172B12|nr:helix-turn-helix transcriptional regulator [Variovorax sp. RA8]VTU21465.1 ATP-dependent transcriptional regulator [Variovorax sp. RA8]
MKRSRMLDLTRVREAAVRIRQLSCLDVTGPHLAPLLLRELRGVLAFDTGGYFHPGADGRLESFMEAPDIQAMVPIYLDERLQRDERRVARSYEQAARTEIGPQVRDQLIKVPWAEFQRSDYNNVLLRPVGLHDCVSLMPRHADGRPVGSIKLYRRTTLLDFRSDELHEFARLERFLAVALTPPEGTAASHEMDAQGTEMLVATPEGRLLWMSAQGAALMAAAFGSHWRPSGQLPDSLKLVLQRLAWVRSGHNASDAPRLEIRNAHGLFTIRGCSLHAAAAGEPEVVGIQITLHVHRALRLLQALRLLSLSPRQSEIGFWLARGLSEPEIAQRMKLSLHTVVYHRRQLHDRLGTRNRKELLARLLGSLAGAQS